MQTNRKLPRKYQQINRNVLNFRDETWAPGKKMLLRIFYLKTHKCMTIISSKYKYYLINIVFIVQMCSKCLKMNTLGYRIIRDFRCKDSKHYILQLNVHSITSKDSYLLLIWITNTGIFQMRNFRFDGKI